VADEQVMNIRTSINKGHFWKTHLHVDTKLYKVRQIRGPRSDYAKYRLLGYDAV
jgi:hypothetical protein